MKTVEQTLIEAGRCYTIAAASGNVIGYVPDAADGAELRLGKYEHKPEQEWLFDRVGENSYRIHCRANDKVIDLMMAGTDNGTWLHLWEDVLGSSQVWTLVPANDGTVRIISQWASGKCVDTVGIGSGVGAILQIWQQESAGADQLWTIRAVKDRKPAPEAEAPAEEQPAEAPAAPAEEKPAEVPAAPAEEKPAEVPAAPAEEKPAEVPAAPAEEKAAETAAAPVEEKPKRRACRTKKTAEAPAEAEAAPAKTGRKTAKKAEEKPAETVSAEAAAAPAEEKPKRRACRTKKAAEAPAVAQTAGAQTAGAQTAGAQTAEAQTAETPAEKPKRRTSRSKKA